MPLKPEKNFDLREVEHGSHGFYGLARSHGVYGLARIDEHPVCANRRESVYSVKSVFYVNSSQERESSMKQAALTRQIIGAFFQVYNVLGYGFLERVYQNSLVIELRRLGLRAVCDQPVRVYYTGIEVGLYAPDIVVNRSVIVELKSAVTLHPAHEAQLTNYLRATEIEVGLLLNFGQEPQFSRRIFTNDRKKLGNPGSCRSGES